MLESFIEFLKLLWGILSQIFQWIGALTLFLLITYFVFPERYEKILIHFLKIASYFAKHMDKNYVERDVKHLVDVTARTLNKYFPVISRSIKILWVESDEIESYLDRGFVVVRMKYHKSRARNIARALVAYIPYILPSEVEAVIEADLALVISCVIAKRMAEKEPEVVRQIYEAISIRFEDGSAAKEKHEKLEEIDEQSLLSRILLSEITKACLNAYPRRPPDLRDEIESLIDMLSKIVKREIEKPIIRGKYVNLALVRVAKPEKIILDPELEAHLNFAKLCRTTSIYVLAAGYNAKLASKLTARISRELNYKVDFEDTYKAMYRGNLTDVYCGKLSIKQ